MASKGAAKGISLIKRGWHEIPEIMIGLGMIGFSAVIYVATYFTNDEDRRHRYKFHYTVVRPEDARQEWVKKDIYN